MIFAITGSVPVLVAVKIGKFPEPVAGSPIPVAVLVQVYDVVPPVLFEVKLTAAVDEPLQTTWFAGATTLPSGLTVIVNTFGVPIQLDIPFVKVGVTVILATTGDNPPLTARNEAISPVPDAAMPMAVLSLVQLKVVVPPELFVVKVISGVAAPLHTTLSTGVLT